MSEVMLEHMQATTGGLEVIARHPKFAEIGVAMCNLLHETGADNFLTATCTDGETDYEITVRRCGGETPEIQLNRLKDENKELRDENLLLKILKMTFLGLCLLMPMKIILGLWFTCGHSFSAHYMQRPSRQPYCAQN